MIYTAKTNVGVIQAPTKRELIKKIAFRFQPIKYYGVIFSIKIDFNNGKSRELCNKVVKKIQYDLIISMVDENV